MKEQGTAGTKKYWNAFYKQNVNLPKSSFCSKVQETLTSESFVVDIGCGSGRDTFAFASSGVDAIGIDGSEEAIGLNKSKAEELLLSSKVSFIALDLCKSSDLRNLFEELKNQGIEKQKHLVLYLRFLLHAIDDKTEKTLLETISDVFPQGTKFAAEFRTKEDEQLNKIYDNHYRRFVDTDQLIPDLESKGFEINSFCKGTGLSIYKGEDPFLARVFATKL
ncbi:class I SAM-dependent methyltransferase [Sporosarcina cascadiensis]|uniref:class I SAM-dependent methyltransferase n=1 Tax=Sporosarcina cascadiensis TaxID=2660747 RepID=UPI00129A5C3F|nr:class I SAM-dependent methyltransferase [Sporosarcina cascadiensis]